MGYNTGELRIPLRVSAHNSEQDVIDRRAAENLKLTIQEIIENDIDFRRIALLGVYGGI
jgi:hypothetical protein